MVVLISACIRFLILIIMSLYSKISIHGVSIVSILVSRSASSLSSRTILSRLSTYALSYFFITVIKSEFLTSRAFFMSNYPLFCLAYCNPYLDIYSWLPVRFYFIYISDRCG